MVYANVTAAGAAVQAPPIVQEPPVVKELHSLFNRLDDAPLLQALAGPVRPGPKTHSVSVLWHCFLLKHYLSLPSTEAMIRTLHQSPFVAMACGIRCAEAIPHKNTFSRFFSKLSKRDYLPKLKDVSRSLVRKRYEETPGFGKVTALDRTTLRAWSNGGKVPYSDPQAGWSIKTNSHGKREFTLGWKLHLLTDCGAGDFPIAANISAGNVHDSQRVSNVLSEARKTYTRFLPRFIVMDAGYSSREIFHVVRDQYKSQPAIRLNPQHRTLLRTEGQRQDTPEFQALFKMRQSVERCFSLLKRRRSLNAITMQGIRKVTVHCYLSLIVMQAVH